MQLSRIHLSFIYNFSSYCSEHFWRRRRPIKVNKKSIFYSTDQRNEGHHHRLHSCKPNKRTSGSSSSSVNSSNKKTHHRRKRRRRPARSKSRKRSSSAKISPENTIIDPNDKHISLSSALDVQSISDEDDDSIENIGNQLAEMNCEGEQDLCDDSDSLDEALDAEHLDDEDGNYFDSSDIPTNVQ
jgi:hypothetical protein